MKNHTFPASQICPEGRSNTEIFQRFMEHATIFKVRNMLETKCCSCQYNEQNLNMHLLTEK